MGTYVRSRVCSGVCVRVWKLWKVTLSHVQNAKPCLLPEPRVRSKNMLFFAHRHAHTKIKKQTCWWVWTRGLLCCVNMLLEGGGGGQCLSTMRLLEMSGYVAHVIMHTHTHTCTHTHTHKCKHTLSLTHTRIHAYTHTRRVWFQKLPGRFFGPVMLMGLGFWIGTLSLSASLYLSFSHAHTNTRTRAHKPIHIQLHICT